MGHHPSEIAEVMRVDKSTLRRGLKRNSRKCGYRSRQARRRLISRLLPKMPL